jgi:dTDP-4-dehydrorhamnose 3,5-epimerase
MYKCTDLYAPKDEYGIIWSDSTLAIDWLIDSPTLSEKDSRYPELKDISGELLPVYKNEFKH